MEGLGTSSGFHSRPFSTGNLNFLKTGLVAWFTMDAVEFLDPEEVMGEAKNHQRMQNPRPLLCFCFLQRRRSVFFG
jgi:hypothetical protein